MIYIRQNTHRGKSCLGWANSSHGEVWTSCHHNERIHEMEPHRNVHKWSSWLHECLVGWLGKWLPFRCQCPILIKWFLINLHHDEFICISSFHFQNLIFIQKLLFIHTDKSQCSMLGAWRFKHIARKSDT